MKTETLISKLKEKGYIFPTCLQWTDKDIDARMKAIGQGDELKTITQLDKQMILESFFDYAEDLIVEYINQELDDYLQDMARFDVSNIPF